VAALSVSVFLFMHELDLSALFITAMKASLAGILALNSLDAMLFIVYVVIYSIRFALYERFDRIG
jgi:hypothetical protein